jgi:HEAT repeat protein
MSRFFLTVLAAATLSAQQPDVLNGKVETRSLSGSLAQEFQKLEASAASPVWMAYSFPAVPRQGTMCGTDEHNNLVRLEGPDTLLVLFRFQNHALDRVQVSSFDCRFDAGGLPFVFLTGVPPGQSVDLLSGLVRTPSHGDPVITAIALTRDPAADRSLQALLNPSQPDRVREKVLFWLASARGPSGFGAVKKVLESDPDDQLREKATFDITVSKEAGVMPALVQAARHDRAPRVRKQALFWLARKGGMAQSSVILQVAEQDPDREVRRQAAFALHEIPDGAGIPLLIQLAKTSSDPEVRKQAIFWLGKSNDPRATGFFADVLK